MLRKTVSRIMLILLSISMLTLAIYIQPVKADLGTWIVDERAPSLDHAGMMGSGTRDPLSYAEVSSDYARTGTKSVKLYQISPTKSDAQRRVTCREWSSIDGQTEFYWSWWAYFPDNMGNAQSGIWTNLGGLAIRYGPSSWKHKYYSGVSIYLNDATPRRLYARYHKPYDAGSNYHWSGFYLNSTYLNKWMHFQCYVKYSNTSTGIYRVWIGDGTTTELVLEETGLSNDPRSDSRWESESLYFAYPPDGFYAKFQLYQPKNSPESWYYIDDFVLSLEKAPEDYGVSGPPNLEVGKTVLNQETLTTGMETQTNNGEANMTSTYSHQGSYSANFTTDGSDQSYARAMHIIQPV